MSRSGPGREYGHEDSSGREKRTEWGGGEGATERRKAKAQVNPSWEERIHLCARSCQIVSTHLVLRVNPVVTYKYFSYYLVPQCKITLGFQITKEPNLKRKIKQSTFVRLNETLQVGLQVVPFPRDFQW